MFSHLANLYRLHLVPTVKRLCTRRHLIYTVLTTGVLWVSAATLSLLIFHTAQRMTACEELEREFAAYLNTLSATGVQLPDVRGILAAARAEARHFPCEYCHLVFHHNIDHSSVIGAGILESGIVLFRSPYRNCRAARNEEQFTAFVDREPECP